MHRGQAGLTPADKCRPPVLGRGHKGRKTSLGVTDLHDVHVPFVYFLLDGEPVAQFSIRKAGILEKWRVLFVTSTASSAIA